MGLLGVALVLLVLWGVRGFVSSDPRILARGLRMAAGSLGLGIGVPLLVSGRFAAGLILCGAGAWGLGWFDSLAGVSQADQDGGSPGGREHADADGHAGKGRAASPGAMTEQEAHEILGLDAGAGEREIRLAHRALIKKLHPDAGGVSALAAKVNEAKDVLLKRHLWSPSALDREAGKTAALQRLARGFSVL
jgi:hypothetical protein